MVVFWNALLLTQEAEDCWGKKELAMRLDNGTVLRRKDPSDSRFYQFMKRSEGLNDLRMSSPTASTPLVVDCDPRYGHINY